MYLFLSVLLLILLILSVVTLIRRRCAIKKICCMSCEEKCKLLQELLAPFGYYYCGRQDVISTRNDAWQRQAGYTALFDQAALSLHMVFDALPIYFDYGGQTWLIELWKGQYGINTGAEIGIYYADRIIPPPERSLAHFDAVTDRDRLHVSFTLYHNDRVLAAMSDRSWWLTAFLAGTFTSPARLSMDVAISFPNAEMQRSFLNALRQADNPHLDYRCHCLTVYLHYANGCPSSPICPEQISLLKRLRIAWAQFCNKLLCSLYRLLAHPFTTTLDRVVFLYELLPFLLRRMLKHLKGVFPA